MSRCVPLSIVVPVLNEGAVIDGLLSALSPLQCWGAEIIVVDGGSTDDTRALALAAGSKVLQSPPGRARQMNTGAAEAAGRLLWFLHADAQPTPAVLDAIMALTDDASVQWGRFDISLDDPAPVYRLIGRMINLRSRLTGIATGDQGIFLTREGFERLGGFADIPLMEDVELSRRLRRQQRPRCVTARLGTAARRWQRQGVVRTVLRMWWLRAAYFIGASPHWLARHYPTCPSPADC